MKKVVMLFLLIYAYSAIAQDKAPVAEPAKEAVKVVAAPEETPKFQIKASIDIQGQKAIWDNGGMYNVDQLWGRINFGGVFNSPDFNAALNIRAYPEGFGYEALTGVSFDTWFWKIQANKAEIAKFQITDAWAQYVWKYLSIKVGLFWTDVSQSCLFGNYLDIDPNGGGFISKLATHNALEFFNKTLFFNTSILLGVSDKNVNRGYIRVYEKLTGFPGALEGLSFGIGYRGNVFDKIQYPDDSIQHHFDVNLSWEIFKGLKPYVEFGVVDQRYTKNELTYEYLYKVWDGYFNTTTDNPPMDFDQYVTWYYKTQYKLLTYERRLPFVWGITIPTGPVFDVLAFEMEINSKRQAKDPITKKMVDKPIEMNLYFVKKLGKRVKFTGSIYNDPSSSNMGDFKFALRFSSMLH